uniref:Uncharacterized protein n=1 Tax=Mycena chlorophos TaxID=658473 RepID=A0ABQ0M2X2_MYCCL|nr:predicted protein [Mycena chlorophos]
MNGASFASSLPRPRTSSDSAAPPRRIVDPERAPTPEHRRRVFITDKLAHRVDLALATQSMAAAKVHTSPSKASYGRTYDSKLVSREMHRLAGLAPSLSQTPSVSSLNLPAPGSMAQVSLTSTTDPWISVNIHILPLFNGEHLKVPIEDLNTLVKRHISSVVSSSPSKAIAALENDAAELIASGMVNLSSQLDTDEQSILTQIVSVWEFFLQVLTYIEGVLLPLRTDPLLSTLHRGKPQRPSSPRQGSKGNISMNGSLQAPSIDVRTIALRSFRDKVVIPFAPQLRASILNRQEKEAAPISISQPRLQQLLLILSSQCRRPPAVSLTSAPPQPSSAEAAITELLRLVRSPRPQFDAVNTTPITPARAPSFLSGGLPRDRRGRVAKKQLAGLKITEDGDEDVFGDETPRMGQGLADREREREFLEALRSPDLEPNPATVKGGWGLGNAESSKLEDDEEPLNWDEAQAVVERMVGLQTERR